MSLICYCYCAQSWSHFQVSMSMCLRVTRASREVAQDIQMHSATFCSQPLCYPRTPFSPMYFNSHQSRINPLSACSACLSPSPCPFAPAASPSA
jgi:hypothetical protein